MMNKYRIYCYTDLAGEEEQGREELLVCLFNGHNFIQYNLQILRQHQMKDLKKGNNKHQTTRAPNTSGKKNPTNKHSQKHPPKNLMIKKSLL